MSLSPVKVIKKDLRTSMGDVTYSITPASFLLAVWSITPALPAANPMSNIIKRTRTWFITNLRSIGIPPVKSMSL